MEHINLDGSVTFLKNLSRNVDEITSKSGKHSIRVARWVMVIATRLGLKESEIDSLCMGALFHDIGKIGIPKNILMKEGPLTKDEWRIIQLHPIIGQSIVDAARSMPEVADMVYLHQEKYNGDGYPVGLAGKDIPLSARILSVVDAYDAMTDDRPYRQACSQEYAENELQRLSGQQFDPKVVSVFMELLEADGGPIH